MIKSSRVMVAAAVALGLAAGTGIASAQSRAQIVAQPAKVVASAAVTPAAAPQRSGVIPVTPAPLPTLPPNFCFRGNSSGVSRC